MKRQPLSHYLDLIKSTQDKKDWNKAKRYGEIALKKLPYLSYSLFDKYLLYCRLGFSYFRLSKYSISLDMYYTAHLIASKHHLAPEQVIYVNMMLGRNLLCLNRPTQAISQFLKVEEYYPKYGDEKIPMNKERHFVTLINLGWCYVYNEDWGKVKEIIQEKLPPYQNALNNFGEYYYLKGVYLMERKEYTQARHSFNELLKISMELNDFHSIIRAKFSLALIDLYEGQLESAIQILKAILKDARQLKHSEFICRIGLVLGKCYLLKNMPAKSTSLEKTITPLLKSLDITWLYEMTRYIEQLYRRLQPTYQNLASPIIPEILTDKIKEHYHSSFYAKVIIGKSNAIIEVLQLVEKIAPTDLPVLIQGETGTGKELVARAIHQNSLRKEKMWLALNCGAMPETLLENELFGHTKGAFTDAHKDKKGYIELASDGTLFLDEIAEMSPAMQQKLLRVLEEKQVWRVGAEKPIPVNTRFIFASNQNIEERVRQKRFRLDLFHRINTIILTLPPLRERKEDIPLLVNHFLAKYSPTKTHDAQRSAKPPVGITHNAIQIPPAILNLLINYPWPGNIRELQNEMKRICALYPDIIKRLTESLPEPVQMDLTKILSDPIRKYIAPEYTESKKTLSLKYVRENAERTHIKETLEGCHGNLTKTAHLLGYNRTALYKKMKQLGITLSD